MTSVMRVRTGSSFAWLSATNGAWASDNSLIDGSSGDTGTGITGADYLYALIINDPAVAVVGIKTTYSVAHSPGHGGSLVTGDIAIAGSNDGIAWTDIAYGDTSSSSAGLRQMPSSNLWGEYLCAPSGPGLPNVTAYLYYQIAWVGNEFITTTANVPITVTDLRLNANTTGTGTDLTPGYSAYAADTVHFVDAGHGLATIVKSDTVTFADVAKARAKAIAVETISFTDAVGLKATIKATDTLHVSDGIAVGIRISAYDLITLAESVDPITTTAIRYQQKASGGSVYPVAPPSVNDAGWLPANLLIDYAAGDMVSGYTVLGGSPLLWVIGDMSRKTTVAGIEIAGPFGANPIIVNVYGSNNGETWSGIGWLIGGNSYRDLTITGTETTWQEIGGDYHYYAIVFRCAGNTTFKLTDLRFNTGVDGSGVDVTPGLIRVMDRTTFTDAVSSTLLIKWTDSLSMADAAKLKYLPLAAYSLQHPDQHLGLDPGFAMNFPNNIKRVVDAIFFSDVLGVDKTITATDTISFVDIARLKVVFRTVTDSINMTDSAAALPGLQEHAAFTDRASVAVLVQALDSIHFNDRAVGGILKLNTDTLTLTDATSLALAAIAAQDNLRLGDVATVIGPKVDTEGAAFSDIARVQVLVQATDRISMSDKGYVLITLEPVTDSVGMTDSAAVIAYTVQAMDNVRFAETIILPAGDIFQIADGEGAAFSDIARVAVAVQVGDEITLTDSAAAPAAPTASESVGFSDSVTVSKVAAPYTTLWS